MLRMPPCVCLIAPVFELSRSAGARSKVSKVPRSVVLVAAYNRVSRRVEVVAGNLPEARPCEFVSRSIQNHPEQVRLFDFTTWRQGSAGCRRGVGRSQPEALTEISSERVSWFHQFQSRNSTSSQGPIRLLLMAWLKDLEAVDTEHCSSPSPGSPLFTSRLE